MGGSVKISYVEVLFGRWVKGDVMIARQPLAGRRAAVVIPE